MGLRPKTMIPSHVDCTRRFGQCFNAFYHQLLYPCAQIYMRMTCQYIVSYCLKEEGWIAVFFCCPGIQSICINIFCPPLIFFRIGQRFGRGNAKGHGEKINKYSFLDCKEGILHKRFFQILLRIGLYLNHVGLLDGESYSNFDRCKNAENMQI